MTAKELFDVVVRGIGIWLLVRGIQRLVAAGYYVWQTDLSADVVGNHLIAATAEFLLGLFFLAKATAIANAFYGSRERNKNDG